MKNEIILFRKEAPVSKIVFIFMLLMGCLDFAYAGNIDLLWNGSNVYGIKNSTLGVDISDNITDQLEISGYYRKGKTDDVITQDEGKINLNYDPSISDRWSLWLDERIQYNEMIGLDFENDLGIGLKYYVYKQAETKFSLSSGILYQLTSSDCDAPATCSQGDHGRYSNRAKFSNEIISLIYFYQPDIHDSSDYITTFVGKGLVKIKDNSSLLFDYKNNYRSLYGRSESGGIKIRIEY